MKKSIKFAQQLRKVMDSGGLTQQDIAALLEISQPAVSLYLRGRIPPADILLKLTEISGENMEWLLTGSSGLQREGIREHPGIYGSEQKLLEYWKQLTPEIRKTLLKLMAHLAKSPAG